MLTESKLKVGRLTYSEKSVFQSFISPYLFTLCSNQPLLWKKKFL